MNLSRSEESQKLQPTDDPDELKASSLLIAQRSVNTDLINNNAKKERDARKCFISVNAQAKTNWDLFIMILATFNCFTIPLDVSFEPPSFKNRSFEFINNLVDLAFVLDIIISFRTTFINTRTGDEVTSSKEMSIKYLKGAFTIDVAATLPFDKLGTLFVSGKNL